MKKSIGCAVFAIAALWATGCARHSTMNDPDGPHPGDGGRGDRDGGALERDPGVGDSDGGGRDGADLAGETQADGDLGVSPDLGDSSQGAADLAGPGARPDLSLPGDLGCRMIIGGQLDVDVPAVTLTGTLTVNRKQATGGGGTFWLVNGQSGDEALLGDPASASYTARIVPGLYDIVYRYDPLFLYAGAARNTNVVVKTSVLVQASGTFDADLTVRTVSGKVTIAGAAPVGSGSARLYLKSATREDEAPIFIFNNATTYSALVVPDTYDVYYRSMGADGPVANTDAKIVSGVTVRGSDVTLDIDVPAISLSGNLLADGQLNNIYGYCDVFLRRSGGDSAKLGLAGYGIKYFKKIIPGTYELYCGNTSYDPVGDATRNFNRKFGGPVTLTTSSTSYDLDVPIHAITGKGTINGAIAPSGGGRIYFRKQAGEEQLGPDDYAFIGYPNEASFYAAHVLPGRYDVYHVVLDGSFANATLRNRNYRVMTGVDVASDMSLVVNVPAHQVSGAVTVNGAAPAGVGGQLILEGTSQPGDAALLGTLGADPSGLIAPGTYDLYFSWVVYADDLALRNTRLKVASGIGVSAATHFAADISATRLTGKITINGMVDYYNLDSRIELHSLDGTDSARLANISDHTHNSWVASGVYTVHHVNTYPSRSEADDVRNANARLGCVIVP